MYTLLKGSLPFDNSDEDELAELICDAEVCCPACKNHLLLMVPFNSDNVFASIYSLI